MPVSKEKDFLHPLTDKWMPLVNRFALRYNHPLLDLQQEAYLLEWRMSEKTFKSEKHKQRYFSKCLYHQLYRRVKGWGILEPTIDGGWHHKHYKNKKTARPPAERKTIVFSGADINDVIDSIIQMRPFDEVYYEDLVNHTAMVLANQNLLASKIFLDRMKLQITWKELRLKQYKKYPHHKFYDAVKLIKTVVRQEVCYA